MLPYKLQIVFLPSTWQFQFTKANCAHVMSLWLNIFPDMFEFDIIIVID